MVFRNYYVVLFTFFWPLVVVGSPGGQELPIPDNPVEVGNVEWTRDLETALKKSGISGKPVFLFFQEIPGCVGCQTFGREVLTHSLLVEAIENEFLPVLIYNNRVGGADEKILRRFGEPSWNFQVIRFLNALGADIIPRKDKIWSVGAVAGRMVEALEATGRPVPLYLQAIVWENDVSHHGIAGVRSAPADDQKK